MIYCISGLPGSGKTTYVKEHMKPGDIVYDFDYLCAALTYGEVHEADRLPNVVNVVNSMLQFIITAYKEYSTCDLWIVRTAPWGDELAMLFLENVKFIILDTPYLTCAARVEARGVGIRLDFEALENRLDNLRMAIMARERFLKNIN